MTRDRAIFYEGKSHMKGYVEVFEAAIAQETATGHTFRSPKRDTWPIALVDLRAELRSGRTVRGETAYRERLDRGESPCRVCSL
jgi:hypothetical protein